MERRLTAILASDLQGYSRHAERDEEASTTTLRMYRAVVEELIAAHKGHIFSTAGDAVVAEFPSVVEAIRCAVEIQNEIAERNVAVPEDERMQFRIGVNLGDVIAEENNLLRFRREHRCSPRTNRQSGRNLYLANCLRSNS